MNASQKKKVMLGAGALGLLLLAMRQRLGRGTVLVGPVTVTTENLHLAADTEAQVQRLSLATVQSRKIMGYDPNTFASRQPTAVETSYIESTIALGKQLALVSQGKVPYSNTLENMLALAKRLPGSTLQAANSELYALLGIDPQAMNEPTKALTAPNEVKARALIAKWRPYSQEAVDTLFVLLDEARELGGLA